MTDNGKIHKRSRVRHVRTGWEGTVQRVLKGHRDTLYLVSWRRWSDLEYSACRAEELEKLEDEPLGP